MIVVLVVLGLFVVVVGCSIVGARRGTPMAFEANESEVERGRAGARYFDGLGPGGGPPD